MNAQQQNWQKLYQLAILETDWSIQGDRVRAAEAAIGQRLQELSLDHGGTLEEHLAIVDTLQKLSVLRGDLARWHESKDGDARTVSE